MSDTNTLPVTKTDYMLRWSAAIDKANEALGKGASNYVAIMSTFFPEYSTADGRKQLYAVWRGVKHGEKAEAIIRDIEALPVLLTQARNMGTNYRAGVQAA
jgi:hypothetical protein